MLGNKSFPENSRNYFKKLLGKSVRNSFPETPTFRRDAEALQLTLTFKKNFKFIQKGSKHIFPIQILTRPLKVGWGR